MVQWGSVVLVYNKVQNIYNGFGSLQQCGCQIRIPHKHHLLMTKHFLPKLAVSSKSAYTILVIACLVLASVGVP